MTLLAPLFLMTAVAAAALVTALHFLARQHPPPAHLPTARFVPPSPARAPSRAVRPTDLLLLALRVAALLLAGLALARPRLAPSRRPHARIVMLDQSRAVGSPAEARDSAFAWLGPEDALVVFDSSARRVGGAVRDSLAAAPARSKARASLSAALVATLRAAAALAERADSVEIVLVTPLVREAFDAATVAIRRQWPGGIRIVRVGAAVDSAPRGVRVASAAPDDAVRAAVALLGASGATGARIARDEPTAADSAFASGGGVLVLWPSAREAATDSIGAVVAPGAGAGDEIVVTAPFGRRAPTAGAVVARWADGSPAAVERTLGRGCVREVAVQWPAGGDVVLRGNARRFVAAMAQPCGPRRDFASPESGTVAQLAGSAPGAVPREEAPAPPGDGRFPPVSLWLLVAAGAALVAETLVRRPVTPAPEREA